MGDASHEANRSALTPHVGIGRAALVRLDSLGSNFARAFAKYRSSFLDVLAHSYEDYFGDRYHIDRFIEGQSIAYFAVGEEDLVVAASYVKRNLRRAGTGVYPEKYRRQGLARALVVASFKDFPEQYSIVDISNAPMIALLESLEFRRATSEDEVRQATREDFSRISELAQTSSGVIFKRYSDKRGAGRETLTLLHRKADADTR